MECGSTISPDDVVAPARFLAPFWDGGALLFEESGQLVGRREVRIGRGGE